MLNKVLFQNGEFFLVKSSNLQLGPSFYIKVVFFLLLSIIKNYSNLILPMSQIFLPLAWGLEKNFSKYQPSLMVTCLLSYYHVLSMGRGLMLENIFLPIPHAPC